MVATTFPYTNSCTTVFADHPVSLCFRMYTPARFPNHSLRNSRGLEDNTVAYHFTFV